MGRSKIALPLGAGGTAPVPTPLRGHEVNVTVPTIKPRAAPRERSSDSKVVETVDEDVARGTGELTTCRMSIHTED